MNRLTEWLLRGPPWVQYRTRLDLLGQAAGEPQVRAARQSMIAHSQVQTLVAELAEWPGEQPLKRHNDASHSLHKLSVLADFGLCADDPGMGSVLEMVMAHQSPEGAFQTLLNVPKTFGGTGEDTWTWMLCDAPALLYGLVAVGARGAASALGDDERVQRAVEHLVDLVEENGYRCVTAPELGRFRGPGRKSDPCPIANVLVLKALAEASAQGMPVSLDSPAARTGAEMLLWHWEHQAGRKIYMFGIGTTFRRLKYPFIWYDILHVVDVLSRFPFVHGDPRFRQMVDTITAQADGEGRYTAGSMYRAWKSWTFADKKRPSPWLTFLVLRVLKRIGQAALEYTEPCSA